MRFDRFILSHVNYVCVVLQATRTAKITVNVDKFKFAQKKLLWAGYKVKHGGVTVDPSKFQAIARFLRTINITKPRTFMGLVEQLAGFSTKLRLQRGPSVHFLADGGVPYGRNGLDGLRASRLLFSASPKILLSSLCDHHLSC